MEFVFSGRHASIITETAGLEKIYSWGKIWECSIMKSEVKPCKLSNDSCAVFLVINGSMLTKQCLC